MFLNESYYGKDAALIEIENLIGKIKEEAENKGRLSNSINSDPKVIKIAELIQKKFNFESVDLQFIKSIRSHANAYTLPIYVNLWLGMYSGKPDSAFDVVESSTGLKFKNAEGKHAKIGIYDDLILKLEAGQVLAMMLHEIGHNVFKLTQGERIMANALSVVQTLINIMLNPLNAVKLLDHLKFMLMQFLNYSIIGRGFANFVDKYFGWLFLIQEVIMRSISGPSLMLYYINYIFSGAILFNIISATISKFTQRGYENELYADAFAASFGYGKEMYAAVYDSTKYTKSGELMNQNGLGNFILQFEAIATSVPRIFDPHPVDVHRNEFIKEKLRVEIANTNNKVTKKAIQDQLDAIEKYENTLKNKDRIDGIRAMQAAFAGNAKVGNLQMALLSLRNYEQIKKDLFLDTAQQGK